MKLIFEESGDFLIFNQFDAHTIRWSIINEVGSIEDCANLANAMIPNGDTPTEKQGGAS
ncbi:MAG: type IV secretion system DNA-binding domain-containing protein [Methylotenera sp.]|nr:type IV secretion system DNA-binding domain-containing protein [Methylotenera sp.]